MTYNLGWREYKISEQSLGSPPCARASFRHEQLSCISVPLHRPRIRASPLPHQVLEMKSSPPTTSCTRGPTHTSWRPRPRSSWMASGRIGQATLACAQLCPGRLDVLGLTLHCLIFVLSDRSSSSARSSVGARSTWCWNNSVPVSLCAFTWAAPRVSPSRTMA